MCCTATAYCACVNLFLLVINTAGEGVLEALTVLGEQNNVVIIKALEAISESDIDAVKKAKYLYDSCQNMDAINEAGEYVVNFITMFKFLCSELWLLLWPLLLLFL